MSGYLVNFGVYIMAMTGLIFFALMVYKKFSQFGSPKALNSRFLSVEETISIAPRKTLYVVRAGKERFLIAGDIDKTTLIAKLNGQQGREDILNQDLTGADINQLPEFRGRNIVSPEINSSQQLKVDAGKMIHQRTNFAGQNNYTQASLKHSSSVDDLPVIVDFPKRPHSETANVLHNMVRKISE